MARLPRLAIAGQPHLALQRGNNGQPVFIDAADREKLLTLATELAPRAGVQLHAYVLLDDEFQWLLTPTRDDSLPLWMQGVGRSYVRYFNDRHGRRGTLWEGRYRATALQPERWLLKAMVALDLAPVQAGLVGEAAAWRWGSLGHYLGRRQERGLTPPLAYWALGNTPFAREAAYADLVREGLSTSEAAQLRDSGWRGWVLGDEAFVARLQQQSPRRLHKARAGRPPSSGRQTSAD
ncbi:transposase [Xenophilus arseniciresistens]|uniref:Transposase n=1 Tax=Xenophilus arseniciresistens TaxID=1283306 RepID=A0AAE3SZ60_9BURK|nr:transposase [Xenophilus arseniciresistens]MDA7415521.1 transposase [Xenophilus arseniciresistens]